MAEQVTEVPTPIEEPKEVTLIVPAPNPQNAPKETKSDKPEEAKKKRPGRKKRSSDESKSTDVGESNGEKKAKKSRSSAKGSRKGVYRPQRGSTKFKLGTIVWVPYKTHAAWPGKVVSTRSSRVDRKIYDAHKPDLVSVEVFAVNEIILVEEKLVAPFKKLLKDHTKNTDPQLDKAIAIAVKATKNEKLIEEYDDIEESYCEICQGSENADKILLCDNCDAGFHTYCLDPPLSEVPEGQWFCPDCTYDGQSQKIDVASISVTRVKNGIIGLANLGSTCYINSTIQCLNGATDFRSTLKNLQSIDQGLLCLFQSVLSGLWTYDGVGFKMLRELKTLSGSTLNRKYHTTEHQDINEYLMELLEYTHQQLKKASNMSIDCLIEPFFDGRLTRTRSCPKGHTSKSHESFRILPLQFPLAVKKTKINSNTLDLTEMFEDLTAEEILECRCSECGGTKDFQFKQKTEIDKFSPILVVQLARFMSFIVEDDGNWWSNKIETEVTFPTANLDLTKIFPSYPKDSPKPIYDLFAVVNHKGTTSGGHYWSYVKHEDGWYSFNDHQVKQVSEKDVPSRAAYMLFYHLKS